MFGIRLSFLSVLGLMAVGPAFAAAAPEKRDLAAEVKAIFQVKCTQCHGPDLAKPKARFGYVLDLKKLAADSEKVVPGKPDKSLLWQLVRDGEMPAEGAKNGPLTAEQKETIQAWIAAGAPAVSSKPPPDPAPEPPAAESVVTPSAGERSLRLLGKFHLLVLHFPIALLLAAAAGEAWSIWRGIGEPSLAVRFCVMLGAISAVVTAPLGWLHAATGFGLSSPVELGWHRLFGTSTAIVAVVVAVVSEIDSRRGLRSGWFRLLLLLVAVLVSVTGFFGGRLVQGDDFFQW